MDAATRREITQRLLAAHDGVLSGALLSGAGLTPGDVEALIRDRVIQRLRRSAFVDAGRWHQSPPWERHALRGRAVALSVPDLGPADGGLALSHHSALALRGLATYGVDDLVHASRIRYGRGRRGGGLWVHSPVPAATVSLVDGVPCTSAALASLQVAAQYGVEAGVVGADSALRAGACIHEEMVVLTSLPCLKNGRPAAQLVAEGADGRRESAGESRTAWLLHTLDVPRAIPQVLIRDSSGAVVARSDFGLEGTRVLIEFDGRLKYADHAALVEEKLREDRLRELGYEVVRLTWADLATPQRVLAKIRAALARAQSRVAG